MTPLYAEDINMLEGVDDKELEAYMEEHPRIVPLFEIDVMEVVGEYAIHKSTQEEAYEPDPTVDGVPQSTRSTGKRNGNITKSQDGAVAWLAQKRSVARTEDNVKVRKESPVFWTEETKRVGI